MKISSFSHKPFVLIIHLNKETMTILSKCGVGSLFPQENQMTVSVTGATGFIGRRLVQRLRAGKMIRLFL